MPNEPFADLSEHALLDLAGPGSFGRGMRYFQDGHAGEIERPSPTVARAVVSGSSDYVVQLRSTGTRIDAACTCPVGQRGETCKHAVAVGLHLLDELGRLDAAHRSPDSTDDVAPKARTRGAKPRAADPIVDLLAMLADTPQATLVEVIIERARFDEQWARELLVTVPARTGGAPDVAAHRSLLQRAFQLRGNLDWRETGPWAAEALAAIDTLEPLVTSTPADAIKLCEYALKRCDAISGRIDDSNGELGVLLGRLTQLHLAACTVDPGNQVQLARRLFQLETAHDLDLVDDAWITYHDVLGDAGRAEYRAVAEAAWRGLPPLPTGPAAQFSPERYAHGRLGIERIITVLARVDHDLPRLIEVLGRDLSAGHQYVSVARACLDLGEYADAIDWAERGLVAFPREGRLRDVRIAAAVATGDAGGALELAWQEFEGSFGVRDFDRLRDCAGEQWSDWRERALEAARAGAAGEHTTGSGGGTRLALLHLHEGDADAAWSVARAFGCTTCTMVDIAAARETTHPEESAVVYLHACDRELETTGAPAYKRAAKWLARADALLASAEGRQRFDDYVRALRATHYRRRTLLELLDKRGWR